MLYNIPLHVHTTFSLSTDGHFSCLIFLVLWIILLWTLAYQYLFEFMISILLDGYLERELLDHLVILCLIFFWEPPYCFPPFHILTNSAQGIQFLHILTSIGYFLFSDNSYSNDYEVVSHCGCFYILSNENTLIYFFLRLKEELFLFFSYHWLICRQTHLRVGEKLYGHAETAAHTWLLSHTHSYSSVKWDDVINGRSFTSNCCIHQGA